MKKCGKKVLAMVLCLGMLWGGGQAAQVPESEQLQQLTGIQAPSAILMSEDGTVLYEKDADTPREPASVTKVMTMLLVMEALESGQITLDEMVTTSAYAASMGGSQIYLKENEQMTVDEMLKSVAVASANDCAVALAEHLAGTEEAFVARMNERATQLGMTNTHFQNCNGLPADGHVTTARDIAIMSRQLIGHEKIFDYTKIWTDWVRNGTFGLTNTNKMINTYQGMTGLKTGYTTGAGYCLSATAERDGLSLITVVMGAADSQSRNADAAALLNYGFAGYQAVTITADQPIMPVKVLLGKQEYVLCQLEERPPLVLKKELVSTLEKELVMAPSLSAPVKAGARAGLLTIRSQGEEIARIPVVTAEKVAKKSPAGLFLELFTVCAMEREEGRM